MSDDKKERGFGCKSDDYKEQSEKRAAKPPKKTPTPAIPTRQEKPKADESE